MSISRLRKSRGFSIVAALVLVALLTLAAVAVQSTVPAITSPASMSAAAVVFNGRIISDSSSNASTRVPVVPGKDVVTILVSSRPQMNMYFPVCPQNPPDATAKMQTFAQNAQKLSVYGKVTANKFGDPTDRCQPDVRNPSRKTPINTDPKTWQQWTLYCQSKGTPTSGTTATAASSQDMTDYSLNQVQGMLNDSSIQCVAVPPGAKAPAASQGTKSPDEIQDLAKQIAQDPSKAATLTQGLNPADRDALNQAFTQQSDQLKTDTASLKAQKSDVDDQISQLKTIAARGGDCSDNVFQSSGAMSGDLCKEQIANLTDQSKGLQSQIDANNQQLKKFAAAQVALNPNNNPPPGAGGISGGGNGGYGSGGYGGGGGYGNGGSFGNPYLGANNVPQSQFGGACVQRYVCSGNMLYYQTPGYQYGVAGQSCVTQPVQQCQYGCMAVNGINGANGTNGSGSFLSDFGAGLQIASQVMRIFGGGGSNNTLANPNLSSQCAMTPQQAQGYQSPYGTGTNGQPCYQPPQQPDPSQCTSGTWKPTSATQNGCTTGWQCVPNNDGGTAAAKPSAQLSCQPQIADVGTPISFSFSCGNSTASKGTGFSTDGATSGATTTPAPTPPSGTNQATFTLTCTNQGVTASAQCQVQLNKPGIVLVTNPRKVNSGETSLIGWVTSGMQSCTISSPDDQSFTARNAGNSSVNGAATTSPITAATRFQLDCQTLSGGSRSATTSVSIN